MTVPASAVNSQAGKLTQALLGQRADLYDLTYKELPRGQRQHLGRGSLTPFSTPSLQTRLPAITGGVATWGPTRRRWSR